MKLVPERWSKGRVEDGLGCGLQRIRIPWAQGQEAVVEGQAEACI